MTYAPGTTRSRFEVVAANDEYRVVGYRRPTYSGFGIGRRHYNILPRVHHERAESSDSQSVWRSGVAAEDGRLGEMIEVVFDGGGKSGVNALHFFEVAGGCVLHTGKVTKALHEMPSQCRIKIG
jgi:hypothetical protein